MAIILMVSRLILAFQYFNIMYHIRAYKGCNTPLALTAAVYLISGLIYGLTFLGFEHDSDNGHTYVAWYVVAAVESICNIIISTKWNVVSFKGTHLIQRMNLLTLIILGEGIINACKNIAKLVKIENAKDAWTAASIGSIIAAVVIIVSLSINPILIC